MSRYIDADALKKRVSELIVPDWTRTLIRSTRSWLDSEPTVDAVPVKWIQSYVKRLEDNGNTFAAVQYEMMIDDYRADGERKDGAE